MPYTPTRPADQQTNPKYGDVGTPELLARKGIRISTFEGQPRAHIIDISPIHTMHERSTITTSQYSAGKHLYECWVRAWHQPSSSEIRERTDGGSRAPEMTTSQIHAMREYDRGMKASQDQIIINQVVLQEISPTTKNMNGYRKQQVLHRLRIALDNIAICYGMHT